MSRSELQDLLLNYEQAVEEDVFCMLRPTARERRLMGEELISRRAEAVWRARDANRRFLDAMLDDLPDPSSPAAPPHRPVCAVRRPDRATVALPAASYGSIASVFLHFLRDWSATCEHVGASTYGPVVHELRQLLPGGGEVLLPGCGLGRLAVDIAAAGYRVEANDVSRLFLTAADWVLNRPPARPLRLFPLAHVFSENWGFEQQYHEVAVPDATASELLAGAPFSGEPPVTLVPGDFIASYRRGSSCHRKFDAIVTCFFLDTVTNIVELIDVLDSLLEEGGVWVNVGPLNFKDEARLKLTWDEIVLMWQNLGYEFKTQKRTDTDYHFPRGEKMYTESYICTLTSAVKRRRSAISSTAASL